MLNIFNLFLFLLALWIGFMIAGNNLSIYFLAFGIFSSALISLISFQLNLINSDSKFLYLSIGFYQHFCGLYFNNFFKSILLIINLAINKRSFHPTLHKVALKENYNFNLALLVFTLNLTTGLVIVAEEENEIHVHAIHEEYFYEFNFLRNIKNLSNINDDNLV